MAITAENASDPASGIALLYLEESSHTGVDFLLPAVTEIDWEPEHLRLLYDSDCTDFQWMTSEPEIGETAPYTEYALKQYQQAEQDYLREASRPSKSGKKFSSAG